MSIAAFDLGRVSGYRQLGTMPAPTASLPTLTIATVVSRNEARAHSTSPYGRPRSPRRRYAGSSLRGSSPPVAPLVMLLLTRLTLDQVKAELAGRVRCLGADCVRVLDELDAALFIPPDAAGAAGVVHVDVGAPPPDGSTTSADDEATIRDGWIDLRACDDKRRLTVEGYRDRRPSLIILSNL